MIEVKKKIVFIVNPFSGTSRKESIDQLVEKHLDHNKYDYSIKFTTHAGHGIELARNLIKENIHIIVAVGGDGTVNEIASVVNNTDKVLGIIPGGSGNGFYMHFGLGRSAIKAIHTINTGSIVKVDTGMMNEHFFLNVAGLGFDARIAYLTKRSPKRGFLHYFITSIKESKHFKPQEIRIETNEKVLEEKFTAAVAANASMYGYNFTVAPFASLNDGMFDLMLIKEAPLYRYFLEAYRFLNKTLHKSSLTETFKTREIKMWAKKPISYHVDGEGFEPKTEFTIRMLPESLNLMVPNFLKV